MNYEVEQKFRVERFEEVEAALAQLGAKIGPVIEQVDGYWAHPVRDFRATDEAFRLRRTGSRNCVTYKGPRIDATTKTRQELELPLPDGTDYGSQFGELLRALGFRPVADVHKCRRKAAVDWNSTSVEVSLDEVSQVGKYVELEVVTDASGLESARQRLAGLATRLGLIHDERRSYLELLPSIVLE